jgi:hypothetical protein
VNAGDNPAKEVFPASAGFFRDTVKRVRKSLLPGDRLPAGPYKQGAGHLLIVSRAGGNPLPIPQVGRSTERRKMIAPDASGAAIFLFFFPLFFPLERGFLDFDFILDIPSYATVSDIS